MTLSSYIEGNILLFNFYFKNFEKIKALPKWMRNPDVLIQEIESKWKGGEESFSLSLPNSTAQC